MILNGSWVIGDRRSFPTICSWILVLFIIFNFIDVECDALKYQGRRSQVQSDLIDEIDAKKLEKLVQEKESVALFLYPRSCIDECQTIVNKLEEINDEANEYGIFLVRNSERAVAKQYDISKMPALVYFKQNSDPSIFSGDLKSSEAMLDWLSSIKSLDMPDKIEQISSSSLSNVIDEYDFVAVFFYEENCKKCERALHRLEEIDDEADDQGIGFVKLADRELAFEYGLETLPALVYYRKKIPIVYTGDLENEHQVLRWLQDFRDTVEDFEESDDDIIEDVNSKVLEALIKNTDYLAVLFYDAGSRISTEVLGELENIDDECDNAGILLVKIDDRGLARHYGLSQQKLPALVYFEQRVPNFYDGDLRNEQQVLDWLLARATADEIEQLTPAMFEQLLSTSDRLAVVLFDRKSSKSSLVLEQLENIDDDCDKLRLQLVKLDDPQMAKRLGVESELPVLIYFENQVPSIYQGDLRNEDKVLRWLQTQVQTDEIEEVNNEILDDLIEQNDHVVVLFYQPQATIGRKSTSKSSKTSSKKGCQPPNVDQVLVALEQIDDECDEQQILFVKTDEIEMMKKYGLPTDECSLPALVYFEDEIPHVYGGSLLDSKETLNWILEQKKSEEIEQINAHILRMLVNEEKEQVAVLFYDPRDSRTQRILIELENIDDECDDHEINFVKIDDPALAKEYGVNDELPALVYFENTLPTVYEGDLMKEEQVLDWLIKQKHEDTIEEVTEEMLEQIIQKHNLVLVLFAPNDCKDCDRILNDLETIDDDTDEHGILFVTTDDLNLAKSRFKLKKFPSLVLIQNEDEFTVYDGDDLSDEQKVLEWVTSQDLLDDSDEIEPVSEKSFEKLLDRSDFVVALFSKRIRCRLCDQVKEELEKIDHLVEKEGIDFVLVDDPDVAEEYSVDEFPAIVFFNKRFPQYFDGPDMLDEDKVLEWILDQKQSGAGTDEIEPVDGDMLRNLLDDLPSIAVFFYDQSVGCGQFTQATNQSKNSRSSSDSSSSSASSNRQSEQCQNILQTLEQIDDEAYALGIHFVRSGDSSLAAELHIHRLPSLVYFEHGLPSIYSGPTDDSEQVLTWLRRQRMEDTIEEISREMLFQLAAQHEYLAVFFYRADDDECEEILEHLELIDDDCGEFEVQLVKLRDELIAKKYGVRQVPALVLFRRQQPIRYDGNLFDEQAVLDWLTRVENMDSRDAIERVNRRMFERLLAKIPHLAVLFYSETDCKQCEKVLTELEKIDDEADQGGVRLVKVDDPALAKRYGVHALPALLFFKHGEDDDPIIFAGDLKRSNKILDWLISQKDPDLDRIEEVEGSQLAQLIEREQHVAVYFYSTDCDDCDEILNDLENIDSDTDRHDILLVKVKDQALANSYGCDELPALVYFEQGMPSVYQEEMNPESVLQWLLQQRSEDTIEEVNREILEHMVDSTHYLVVLFYKSNCRACEIVLEELEHIDDDCDIYGINMVKIQDVQLAKRYAIRTFPALMYFRNGNPLLFDGDLRNEDQVLEWLIDDDNRELQDEIEHVNHRMLEKLIQESPFLVVYFYEDACDESDESCETILANLEQIDDELDVFGIDFVKVNDPAAIRQWRISSLPTLVYFRKRQIHFYDGDLLDEQKLLGWLTSEDVFELKGEIEEVNRKMLDKFLYENDYIAVLFYDNDCLECEEVLKELEHIDDEADDLDIMFVKIKDLRYAKKYGIVSLPSLVFFRKKFPSLYRGDLMKEEEVLEWLKKNRYRHPEISIFMYGLILVTGGFICYTLFLIFFMRPKEKKE